MAQKLLLLKRKKGDILKVESVVFESIHTTSKRASVPEENLRKLHVRSCAEYYRDVEIELDGAKILVSAEELKKAVDNAINA